MHSIQLLQKAASSSIMHHEHALQPLPTKLQDLLHQMLKVKARSRVQCLTSASPALTAYQQPAFRSAPQPVQQAQAELTTSSAPGSLHVRQQRTAQPAEQLSTAPSDSHQVAAASTAATASETAAAASAANALAATAAIAAATGSNAKAPDSSRSMQTVSGQNAVPAEKQPVDLVAKPELYTALTAAVAAIVQQAGLPQIQPAAECLRGISLQYHAGAQGSEPEGKQLQVEGKQAQVEGQLAESERQQPRGEGEQPQVKGHKAESSRQHSNTQQQTACIAAQINQMAAGGRTEEHHPQQVNTQQGLPEATQLQAVHAQCNTALGMGLQQGEPQLRAKDSHSGGTTGHDSGELQAWQMQIQQDMQVLQATLQSTGKAGASPSVALPRQATPPPLNPSQSPLFLSPTALGMWGGGEEVSAQSQTRVSSAWLKLAAR